MHKPILPPRTNTKECKVSLQLGVCGGGLYSSSRTWKTYETDRPWKADMLVLVLSSSLRKSDGSKIGCYSRERAAFSLPASFCFAAHSALNPFIMKTVGIRHRRGNWFHFDSITGNRKWSEVEWTKEFKEVLGGNNQANCTLKLPCSFFVKRTVDLKETPQTFGCSNVWKCIWVFFYLQGVLYNRLIYGGPSCLYSVRTVCIFELSPW